MTVTETGTEKVVGRVKAVSIGTSSSNCTRVTSGILSFEYWRNKDLLRMKIPGSATADTVQDLGMSSYGWRLRFLSDCRSLWFSQDVSTSGGTQPAIVPNGFANKIEYFTVEVAIEDADGVPKTRTYTLHGAYALRHSAYIGDDEDAVFEYEGDAEYIEYSDA